MASRSDYPSNRGIKWWVALFAKDVFLPSLIAFITAFYIQPWATQYWSTPRIKILGVLPIRLIETREGNTPLHRLGLILKVHNPSPSAGIVIPVATIEGCIKIVKDNYSPLYQAAEMSLRPDERVSFGGSTAAARRHQHTVQRIFISGSFRDSPPTNIGISSYGTEYVAVSFPLEVNRDLGTIGSVSLEGSCSDIQERNLRPTLFHILASGSGWDDPMVLRPEFSTGQLKISIHTGSEPVIVPPEVIKPLVDKILWKNWADLLLQQMYENPSIDTPPTRQPPSN